VFGFDRANGLVQRGAWIDPQGSNIWGVEQFTTPSGERLIAISDRDFGLQILRYTGADAPAPPSCGPVSATTAPETPVGIALSCNDPNGNPLTLRKASDPAHGTLGDVDGSTVAYTPEPGFEGVDEFTYVANDGAADSPPATATIEVGEALPSNSFTLRLGKLRGRKLVLVFNVQSPGSLRAGLRARLPGGGAAQAARVVRLARTTRRVSRAGTVRLTLKLSRAKRRQLTRGLNRSSRGRVRGTVKVAFTPTGGKTRRTSRKLTIR
jgi:hypothetical protein